MRKSSVPVNRALPFSLARTCDPVCINHACSRQSQSLVSSVHLNITDERRSMNHARPRYRKAITAYALTGRSVMELTLARHIDEGVNKWHGAITRSSGRSTDTDPADRFRSRRATSNSRGDATDDAFGMFLAPRFPFYYSIIGLSLRNFE